MGRPRWKRRRRPLRRRRRRRSLMRNAVPRIDDVGGDVDGALRVERKFVLVSGLVGEPDGVGAVAGG
jgi:hypothetical protein